MRVEEYENVNGENVIVNVYEIDDPTVPTVDDLQTKINDLQNQLIEVQTQLDIINGADISPQNLPF
jgi:hypothetical protein